MNSVANSNPKPNASTTEKGRQFVFTLNDAMPADMAAVLDVFESKRKPTNQGGCLVAYKEVAPTTGTRHIQGMLHVGKGSRLTSSSLYRAVKAAHKEPSAFGKRSNYFAVSHGPIEMAAGYPAKGSGRDERYADAKDQADNHQVPGWGTFCPFKGSTMVPNSKEGSDAELVHVIGDPLRNGIGGNGPKGSRNDLEDAARDIMENRMDLTKVCEEYPEMVLKYPKGVGILIAQSMKKYTPSGLRGLWFHGEPGTGKSSYAYKRWPDAFRKAQNKWWDGYGSEPVVILDDLDSNVLGHYLKIWADRYPCTGEFKGGTVQLQHDFIIVTSNYSIDQMFGHDPVLAKAIKRRFPSTEFKTLGEVPDVQFHTVNDSEPRMPAGAASASSVGMSSSAASASSSGLGVIPDPPTLVRGGNVYDDPLDLSGLAPDFDPGAQSQSCVPPTPFKSRVAPSSFTGVSPPQATFAPIGVSQFAQNKQKPSRREQQWLARRLTPPTQSLFAKTFYEAAIPDPLHRNLSDAEFDVAAADIARVMDEYCDDCGKEFCECTTSDSMEF